MDARITDPGVQFRLCLAELRGGLEVSPSPLPKPVERTAASLTEPDMDRAMTVVIRGLTGCLGFHPSLQYPEDWMAVGLRSEGFDGRPRLNIKEAPGDWFSIEVDFEH